MIDYLKIARGDILKLVGEGAPGYAKLGDLLRVVVTCANACTVEDRHGKKAEFMYNCGAGRLEETEWKQDFPDNAPSTAKQYQEFLFIGGRVDGKRRKTMGEPEVAVYSTHPDVEKDALGIKRHKYRLCRFACESANFWYYLHSDLTQTQAAELLFTNYKP